MMDRHRGRVTAKQNGRHAWCEKRSPAHQQARCPARGDRCCAGNDADIVWDWEKSHSCRVESMSRHTLGARLSLPNTRRKKKNFQGSFPAHSHILCVVIVWVKGCHENVQPMLI